MKLLLTLIPIALLFSCKKEEKPEGNERFAFTGRITDCYTNAPLKNARVDIRLKNLNNAGFFMWTKEGGSVYSDENGYYYITPLKYDGVSDFEIHYSKDGYFSAINYIDTDSINENGGDLFLFNQGMTEPAVVKLILNNNTLHDSTDKVYVEVVSQRRCDNISYGHALETFTGKVTNKQLDYEINGNDSVHINYTVKKNGIMSKSEVVRFCPAKDTTTISIDY